VGLAADLHDHPLVVDEHLAPAVDGARREHRPHHEPAAVARGDRARPAGERAQRLADDLARRGGLFLAGRGAAVAALGVAVVALLAGLDDAVAAHGPRRLLLAGGGAAVAARGVAGVAL